MLRMKALGVVQTHESFCGHNLCCRWEGIALWRSTTEQLEGQTNRRFYVPNFRLLVLNQHRINSPQIKMCALPSSSQRLSNPSNLLPLVIRRDTCPSTTRAIISPLQLTAARVCFHVNQCCKLSQQQSSLEDRFLWFRRENGFDEVHCWCENDS